jgi:hypothetical protein
MDEDPSNEAYVLALLEGYGVTRPKPWKWSRSLARETGGTNTSPGWIEGSYPRTDPRSDALPGWPSHPRSCPRLRAFNALTPQDARHDPDTPGNHAPVLLHRLPREGHPCHCVALCGEAGVSPVTLRCLLLYG